VDTSVLWWAEGRSGWPWPGNSGASGSTSCWSNGEPAPIPTRARNVNVRTNEIFRAWGIEDEVTAVCLPDEWSRQMC
jgi:hypothetical protein